MHEQQLANKKNTSKYAMLTPKHLFFTPKKSPYTSMKLPKVFSTQKQHKTLNFCSPKSFLTLAISLHHLNQSFLYFSRFFFPSPSPSPQIFSHLEHTNNPKIKKSEKKSKNCCHNGFLFDLDDHKIKWVATNLFCTGVIGHPRCMFLNQGSKSLI